MKLLILGAAGDMGSYILRDSCNQKIWSQITIGDINQKRALQLLKELDDERVSFQHINVLKQSELVSLMQKYDIVISAIGPFYYFGPMVVKASIAAQTPLVDICDDSGPTIEILKMNDEAKKAGVPIFLGFGWTPGLTNLLVRHAYNKLDSNYPTEIDISWAGGAADSEGFAVILHVLYAVTGEFPSFQDGKMIYVPAGKGNVKIDFPEPLGEVSVFDCGHPEPVTIPRYLKNIQRCTLKGGLTPDWNNKFSESMKQLHLTQGNTRKKILGKLVHLTESIFATGGIAASSARVDIYGTYSGNKIHWVYCTPSLEMGKLTGCPASIAAQLFAEKKIREVGIIPPEAIKEPELFFEELKKRNINLIFDEADPLEYFKKPVPFVPSFFSQYGLSIFLLLIFCFLVSILGIFIINLI